MVFRSQQKVSGNATWDRLAEHLSKETENKDLFVINRTFSAPIDLMFSMWTDPKHFSQWMAPAGFSINFIRKDIKPGGESFYMSTDGGNIKMYGKTKYIEITKPHRIVYTQQFCDENEKVIRHPMSPTWPETKLTTVVLSEEGPEETRLTLTWEPYGDVKPIELETFIKARGGMTGGWTGSFDKLEDYLASLLKK